MKRLLGTLKNRFLSFADCGDLNPGRRFLLEAQLGVATRRPFSQRAA